MTIIQRFFNKDKNMAIIDTNTIREIKPKENKNLKDANIVLSDMRNKLKDLNECLLNVNGELKEYIIKRLEVNTNYDKLLEEAKKLYEYEVKSDFVQRKIKILEEELNIEDVYLKSLNEGINALNNSSEQIKIQIDILNIKIIELSSKLKTIELKKNTATVLMNAQKSIDNNTEISDVISFDDEIDLDYYISTFKLKELETENNNNKKTISERLKDRYGD